MMEEREETKRHEKERGAWSSADLVPLVEARSNLVLGPAEGLTEGNIRVLLSDRGIRSTVIVTTGVNESTNSVVVSSLLHLETTGD